MSSRQWSLSKFNSRNVALRPTRFYQTQYTARGQEVAIRFGQRALEIDPNYARAWALIVFCQASLYQRGRFEESGLPAAERALLLDPSFAEAHAAKGRALAELGRLMKRSRRATFSEVRASV
jgi:hypothetical protein